jgi:hypothetical protein
MQSIRPVGREEAAKWFAARRDETAEYRTNLQKKLAFIERNMDEPNKEAVSAVLETFYKREATKLKEDTKNERQLWETRSVPLVAASIEA